MAIDSPTRLWYGSFDCHRKRWASICCGLYELHTKSLTFNLPALKRRVLINSIRQAALARKRIREDVTLQKKAQQLSGLIDIWPHFMFCLFQIFPQFILHGFTEFKIVFPHNTGAHKPFELVSFECENRCEKVLPEFPPGWVPYPLLVKDDH